MISTNRQAWRIARRELRAGLTGFRILIACLALGVAAIAGVGSMSAAITAGLNADAGRLLGGDVDLRLVQRPASPAQLEHLKSQGILSQVIEMRAMARPAATRELRSLIELKAVDDRYPLVGHIELAEKQPLKPALAFDQGHWGAAVDREILSKLALKRGDLIKVGEAEFRINAVIVREPDRVASVFNFGPRVMIAKAALAQTKLIQPGSQIRYHYRLKLPEGVDTAAWIEATDKQFPKAGWRIRDARNAAPGISRFIDRMTLFMTFAGLTALLVGGIGVANAVRSYMEARAATIATLKCLGAPASLVFRAYLFQVLVFACGAIVCGLVIGAVVPFIGARLLEGHLPIAARPDIFPTQLALSALFGLLTALVFALWPLMRARNISGGALFRHAVDPIVRRPRLQDAAAPALGGVALAALTVYAVPDRWFAGWFVVGTLLSLVVLQLAAFLIAAVARRAKPNQATLRLALANLHRPGAQTGSIVQSLGLGLAVLVAISLIEGNLTHRINERLPEEAPAFFFLDIQPHQVAGFDTLVKELPGVREMRRVPSVRGRIVAIAGVPVDQVAVAREYHWAIHGDRALTYAVEKSPDALLVEGQWWPPDYGGPPLISLDAGMARGFGVGLGDTLSLNILGLEVEAKIASLREIDWRSLRFDFAIVFSPGVLEDAPHSHIAAARVDEASESLVERRVAETFANVSAIRVREALDAARAVLLGVGQAIAATAALTLLAGGLVLAGAIAAGRSRLVRDAVVFKVLGATRLLILRAFLLEFGSLGLATGLIAVAVGSLVSWAVIKWVMGGDWIFLPGDAVQTVLLCLAITLGMGFVGTWRALGRKAAPLLRNE